MGGGGGEEFIAIIIFWERGVGLCMYVEYGKIQKGRSSKYN